MRGGGSVGGDNVVRRGGSAVAWRAGSAAVVEVGVFGGGGRLDFGMADNEGRLGIGRIGLSLDPPAIHIVALGARFTKGGGCTAPTTGCDC